MYMARIKKHSQSLISILKPIEPKTGCEVGVWEGHNSLALLDSFPDLTLYMVDYYQLPDEELIRRDRGIRVRPHFCCEEGINKALISAVRATESKKRIILVAESATAADLFCNQSLDFVFIDADHLYERVKRDLLLWASKVRSDGIIAGHDYGGRGDKHRNWGVTRAVNEFAEDNEYELNTASGLVWWIQMP